MQGLDIFKALKSMTYSVKEIFTRCKAKDCAPDGPRFFVVSPAVIYGRDAKKTAQAQSANFATRTLSGRTVPLAASFTMQTRSPNRSPRYGLLVMLTAMWC